MVIDTDSFKAAMAGSHTKLSTCDYPTGLCTCQPSKTEPPPPKTEPPQEPPP
jgi:hypothetical protein